jgi:hypothetical protein
MFLKGTIAVDPSQETRIDIIQPTKVFGRILHVLTGGASTEKEERETFTAFSILQQLNVSLRSMGINNIVRLAKDKYDFYLDTEGRVDDLKNAMDSYLEKVDSIEFDMFEELLLVLEHKDDQFSYLVEINISRVHKVNEKPIRIGVSAYATDFESSGSDAAEKLKTRMKETFKDQVSYDGFIERKRASFATFMSSLEMEIRKFIHCDAIKNDIRLKLIRPKKRVTSKSSIPTTVETSPSYYYGFADHLYYSYLWADLCHHNNIHCSSLDIVDENGADVMSIDAAGFDAGDGDTLNPEADFEAPATGAENVHEGSEYDADLKDFAMHSSGSESADSSGFFDSFTGGDSDSGSSCSSCSGCGGD